FFVGKRNEAVADIRADRLHPVRDGGRNRQPDPVAAVAPYEVDLADRLAIQPIVEHLGLTGALHDLQPVGADIGDQYVAVAGEGQPVRQRAFGETLRIVGGAGKGVAGRLRDDPLRAIRSYVDHAAARVSRPERSVTLGEDTFRPLQIMADGPDRGRIDLEAVDGIGSHGQNFTMSPPLSSSTARASAGLAIS